MPTESAGEEDVLRIGGADPLVVPYDDLPEAIDGPLVRDRIGFECASGDWLEGEWTGVPVLDLLEAADVPADTTHVQFESVDGERACVPLDALTDAIVAVGEDPDLPRFVSPDVIGPRTIKRLSRVRPRTLAPGEDRNRYERLPIDD